MKDNTTEPPPQDPIDILKKCFPAFKLGLDAAEALTFAPVFQYGDIAAGAESKDEQTMAVQYLAGLGYGYMTGCAAVYAMLTIHRPDYAEAFQKYAASVANEWPAIAADALEETKKRKEAQANG